MPVLSPEQFLIRVKQGALAPAYLFVGPEGYFRGRCREALLERALAPEARQDGLTPVDLEETSLSDVLDDARSLSLFASERVIWVSSAELALPRRLSSDEDGENEKGSESSLASYLKHPTPGTTLLFECSRFDFTGDDRPKLERVQKFFADIPVSVEFRPLTPEASR